MVPLRLYFNERGIAKLELGLAHGKRQYDKRETEKKRDWQRPTGAADARKGLRWPRTIRAASTFLTALLAYRQMQS